MDDIARAKYDLDVVGHYARPDIFRLTVDCTSRPAAVRKGDEEAISASDDAANEDGPAAQRDRPTASPAARGSDDLPPPDSDSPAG